MPKFRKKPVVIEAFQFKGVEEMPEWAKGKCDYIPEDRSNFKVILPQLRIATLEGTMFASVFDWVIHGVKDEVYPCKPDIFEATYERVED